MHVQIQMLNNSPLKDRDKLEEKNTVLNLHGTTRHLCFPTNPHPRELHREQIKLVAAGAHKGKH